MVCLVTGASKGIGRATCELLARRGHRVYGGMREPEGRSAEFADELRRSCEVLEMDVDRAESVKAAVAAVVEREGRVDAVVNNAGFAMFGPVEEASLEDAHRLFETNFFGALRVTQQVAPIMRQQGSGVIVQISSISGRSVTPLMGMYAASKFALEAMSEAVAYEIGHFGVRVAIIEPGNYETPIRVERSDGLLDGSSAYIELAQTRKADPNGMLRRKPVEECAEVIVRAIEDDSTPLRVQAGEDAITIVGERQRLDDEAYRRYVWELFNMSW